MPDEPTPPQPNEDKDKENQGRFPSPEEFLKQIRDRGGRDPIGTTRDILKSQAGPKAREGLTSRFHKDLKPSSWLEPLECGLDALKDLKERYRSKLSEEQIVQLDSAYSELRQEILKVRGNNYTSSTEMDVKRRQIEQRLNELVMEFFPDLKKSFHDLCDDWYQPTSGVAAQNAPKYTLDNAEGLRRWWKEIVEEDPYLKCFVVAAFVLYGSPVHRVAQARDELFQYYLSDLKKDDKRDAQQRASKESIDDLLSNSYTLLVRFEGADRLYWNKDEYIPLLQDFMARQATIAGIRFGSMNFLDILEKWAASEDNDTSWRAVRTLAAIWWRQSQNKIWELLDAWTYIDPVHSLQNSIDLLLATVDEERNTLHDGQKTDKDRATALSEESFKELVTSRKIAALTRNNPDENMTLVLAAAYSAIGKVYPDLALNELDTLFHITPKQLQAREIEESSLLIFVLVGGESYLAIAQAGHIRNVLRHIASSAAFLANNAVRDAKDEARAHHSIVFLFVFYFLFGYIATVSVVSTQKNPGPYERRLRIPEFPEFPSDDGRDLLLAGLLSVYERDWRISLRVTLAAAISLGHDDFVLPFLKDWATIVVTEMAQKKGQQNNTDKSIYESYGAFVIEIVKWVDEWCQRQALKGLNTPSRILRKRLEEWAKESAIENAKKDAIQNTFAQDVIKSL